MMFMHNFDKTFHFHYADLDIGELATGFGLLQLPKMPELKGKQFPNFVPTNIDVNKIAFK